MPHPVKIFFIFLAFHLAGCSHTYYSQIRIISDPGWAHVINEKTGEYLAQTPAQPVLTARFNMFSEKTKEFSLLFRYKDLCDSTVKLIVEEEFWHREIDATNGGRVVSVLGILGNPPCTASEK